MSRSTYIYAVTDSAGAPIGAFTVKHELERALSELRDRQLVGVTRMRDGYLGLGALPVELDPVTLKPAV